MDKNGKEDGKVICTKCHYIFEGKPKRTFLGYFKYHCPKCGKKFLYPLSDSYQKIYLVLIGLAIVGIFVWGGLIMPLVIVAALVAIIKHVAIIRDIREAWKETKGANNSSKSG